MKGHTYDDTLIVMDPTDTVATALREIDPGEAIRVEDRTVEVTESIPFGHKVALGSHDVNDAVRKYGEVIGRATETIEIGAWVHTHNVESNRGRPDRDGSEAGIEPEGQR